ncbi:MAG: hypothetical protein PHN90_13910 [Methanothrix sp.]|nr:hypothetical protein [Methanothrix sp.]HNR58930.1 hypothetical protein [Methanothrix sp.]HOI69430.1 hypothetical protein [Methanothrix sp.]
MSPPDVHNLCGNNVASSVPSPSQPSIHSLRGGRRRLLGIRTALYRSSLRLKGLEMEKPFWEVYVFRLS